MRTTIFERRGKLLALFLLLLISGAASAAVTNSFTAKYEVSYGFLGLGHLTFSLKPANTPGCYVYSGHGNPNAIVSMLVGTLSDESRFCVTDSGGIRPLYFRHHEDGHPKNSYTLTFNWDSGVVRYQNRDGNIRILTLPKTATDPLSLQIAARLWLEKAQQPEQLPNRGFTLVDEDDIKTYTLAVKPGGTVTVPAGRYDTLIVERVDNEDKHLRFWLAKYADWIPVRVEHEAHGRVITMNLTSLVRK